MTENIDKYIKCVGRELGMRKSAYPKWVASGKMQQEKADEEISTMSELYDYLKKEKDKKYYLLFQTDIWESRATAICFGVFESEELALQKAKENYLYSYDSKVIVKEVELNEFGV